MIRRIAVALCASATTFGSPAAANADATLTNPDWEIIVTDFGYSDFLFYNSGPFPRLDDQLVVLRHHRSDRSVGSR